MAVTQRLELRQSQSLVMTPQLQQAIKLLQLSSMELAAYVERELERNPLLERDEGTEGEESDRAEADAPAGEAAVEPPDSLDLTQAESLPANAEAPLDTDFENLYDSGPGDAWAGSAGSQRTGKDSGGRFETDERSIDQRLSERVTLRGHLLEQLQMDIRDPVERMIGIHLIEMLDEAGYLTGEIEQVARALDCDLARVEATLAAVQRFDPPGIFARSLRECLALQLADRNRLDPAMAAMLDHLQLVAKRDLAALGRICGVEDEDLADMLAEIKSLDPKPAQAYDFEIAEPIVPDVLMRRSPDGGWIVELNSATLPRVLVNARYYTLVAGKARSKAEKDYISEQFQSANWLVRSLHQRATTILKVAGEIIRQQDGFFRKGVRHMKPLTLRQIAEVIEMHESTVSRVTSNKYIATPRGIYELKYFFTSAIPGTDGQVHSAESVRHRIKALVDAENGTEILSDDTIVELLRRDGVDIARRTVAKYRGAMRIPSSVQRRRDKAVRP
ncbi:MAG: RNA polymerase factor sigma-54 [Proteobacteria bacterium]|nr:RNA polymerase factor sigma-54 [Pseudomonadota bacterium]